MNRLHVDDTGVLETTSNFVNPVGFKVYFSGPYCDRRYSPAPMAAAVTAVTRSQRRDFIFAFGASVDASLRNGNANAVRLNGPGRVSGRMAGSHAFGFRERRSIEGMGWV